MRSYFFLIFIFFFLFHSSYSQDSIKPIRFLGKKWKKGTINFSASTVKDRYYRNRYNFNDFVSNSKNSSKFFNFNKNDFYEYNSYDSRSGVYNLSLSFYPYNKKLNDYNPNHEIRLGIVYYTGIDHDINFSSKYFRSMHVYGYGPDTSYIANISYKQVTDEVGIELAYLFRSPIFIKRFSFFGGIATGVSLSVFSETEEEINRFTSKQVCDTTSGNTYCNYVANNEYISNYYTNSTAYSIKAFLPYGINFLLVKTLSFYVEGRTGFSYHKFTGGKAKLRTHHGIGIGVRFLF